jgi:hypothetical protein
MNKTGWSAVICLALFFSGCASFPDLGHLFKPTITPQAESLLNTLNNRNDGLDSFKGIGKAKVTIAGQTRVARVAWLGAGRKQLRIEVLAMTGQPVASFANDGSWVYLLARNPSAFYKRRASTDSLQNLLSIPVSSDELVMLISGRIPIRNHKGAAVVTTSKKKEQRQPEAEDTADMETRLDLKTFWDITVQQIFIDTGTGDVLRVEEFDRDGTLVYRVVFGKTMAINGFKIPSRLAITSNEGLNFNLDIQRYWTNVPVEAKMFVLTAPDNENQSK